ncbi:hypothetical protein VPH35_108631 [Triticum aestivum]
MPGRRRVHAAGHVLRRVHQHGRRAPMPVPAWRPRRPAHKKWLHQIFSRFKCRHWSWQWSSPSNHGTWCYFGDPEDEATEGKNAQEEILQAKSRASVAAIGVSEGGHRREDDHSLGGATKGHKQFRQSSRDWWRRAWHGLQRDHVRPARRGDQEVQSRDPEGDRRVYKCGSHPLTDQPPKRGETLWVLPWDGGAFAGVRVHLQWDPLPSSPCPRTRAIPGMGRSDKDCNRNCKSSCLPSLVRVVPYSPQGYQVPKHSVRWHSHSKGVRLWSFEVHSGRSNRDRNRYPRDIWVPRPLVFLLGTAHREERRLQLRCPPHGTFDKEKPCSYRSSEEETLVSYFTSSLAAGKLVRVLDPQVVEEGGKEVKEVAVLAMACVRIEGDHRPSMRQVELTLESLGASHDSFVMHDMHVPKYPVIEGTNMEETSRQYSLEAEYLLSSRYPR